MKPDAQERFRVYQEGQRSAGNENAKCPYDFFDWRSKTWLKGRTAATEYYESMMREAQPKELEQETVAHTLNCVCGAVWDIKNDGSEEMVHAPDTTPPQRKPLTEDEITALDEWLFDQPLWRVVMLVRAIEAAHGIKE